MSFLSSESLKVILPEVIDPYNEKRVKHGAYELSLGGESYVTDRNKKNVHGPSDQIVIEPGQFALLLTNEIIEIPLNNIAFISIKAGTKFKGLVNVSGFHVDPGFCGRLKFTVYNAGGNDINLTVGEPLFMIWYAELDRKTEDKYNGRHNGQNEITSNDVMNIQGDLASPHKLKEELESFKNRFNTIVAIIITLLISIFVAILISILN